MLCAHQRPYTGCTHRHFLHHRKQTYFWESNLRQLRLARVPVEMLTHYTNPPQFFGITLKIDAGGDQKHTILLQWPNPEFQYLAVSCVLYIMAIARQLQSSQNPKYCSVNTHSCVSNSLLNMFFFVVQCPEIYFSLIRWRSQL